MTAIEVNASLETRPADEFRSDFNDELVGRELSCLDLSHTFAEGMRLDRPAYRAEQTW